MDGVGVRVDQPGAAEEEQQGVSRAQKAPEAAVVPLAYASTGSSSGSSPGAVAMGTARPWAPWTASETGVRSGATATTVQPRRYACSARRARPGSPPSGVAMRSRSTGPPARQGPAQGARGGGHAGRAERDHGAGAAREGAEEVGGGGGRRTGAYDQHGTGAAVGV